jgi:hypothetical protein
LIEFLHNIIIQHLRRFCVAFYFSNEKGAAAQLTIQLVVQQPLYLMGYAVLHLHTSIIQTLTACY